MTETPLVDRLAGHRTLAGVPREQLAWLISHGRLRQFETGELIAPTLGKLDALYILLQGHLSIRVNRGAGPRRVMDWHGGDITGLLPYSRLQASPGQLVAEEPTEAVVVHRDEFPKMVTACHELTSVLVHVMVDRARHFTSSDFHDEKML